MILCLISAKMLHKNIKARRVFLKIRQKPTLILKTLATFLQEGNFKIPTFQEVYNWSLLGKENGITSYKSKINTFTQKQ